MGVVLGFGAFVNIGDVSAAGCSALIVLVDGYVSVLLCAASFEAAIPSLELATRFAPNVPVTDLGCYQAEPLLPASLFSGRQRARLAGRPPMITPRETGNTPPACDPPASG